MKKLIVILFILINIALQAQQPSLYTQTKSVFLNPISINGELNFFAQYRLREIQSENINETQNSTLLNAGIKLISRNYILSPEFITLELDAEYNPSLNKQNFVSIPDINEVRTLKKAGIRTSVFKTKNISLSTVTDFSQTLSNRENLSNIKTDRFMAGTLVSLKNKIVPLSLNFNKSNLYQQETESGRFSEMDMTNIKAVAVKSFYKIDKQELIYSNNNYKYNYNNIFNTDISTENLALNNNIFFDKKRNFNLRSLASINKQTGTISFTRNQINEYLQMKLPLNFLFSGNYNYNDIRQENSNTYLNNYKISLKHQLYLSLTSSVFYDYSEVSNTFYSEKNKTSGFDIFYTKKIPLKGRLNLSATYQNRTNYTTSQPNIIQIINEQHFLSDGTIELLDRPNININSIIVKDETGTIIFIENIDYILIQHDAYIEIQRFPGGQIADNSTIFVDYSATQPESYSYKSNFYIVSGNIKVLNNLFEIYFRNTKNNFYNLNNTEFLSLNYYNQKIFGIKAEYKFVNAGFESDNCQSTIIPYKSNRYFINFQHSFNNQILVSLSANYRKYLLTETDETQIFSDITSKAVYFFKNSVSISADIAYRKQTGNGIDLSLFTARSEIKSTIRQLEISAGAESYYKKFIGETNIYQGIFFKLIRRF